MKIGTIEELKNEILNILGLTITNGKIFDIDTGQYLLFNGNFIYDENSALLIHKNDIKFNPFTTLKLAEYLLHVLLQKESKENNVYTKLLSIGDYSIRNPLHNFIKHNISVQLQFTVDNKPVIETIFSDYFYNLCLAYIHLIYKVSCTPLSFNLSDFDYSEEYMIQQSKRDKR